MKKFILNLLLSALVLVTILSSCANNDDDKKTSDAEVLFTVKEGEIISETVSTDVSSRYPGFLCEVFPQEKNDHCYLLLHRLNKSETFIEELFVVDYNYKDNTYTELCHQDDLSLTILDTVPVNSELYSLLRSKEGKTSVCTYGKDGIRELYSLSEGESAAISGGNYLSMFIYGKDNICLKVYDPENDSFIDGANDIACISFGEKPSVAGNGLTVLLRSPSREPLLSDEKLKMVLVPAKTSGEINTELFQINIPEDVVPSRIMISNNYLVFADGVEDDADLYYLNVYDLTHNVEKGTTPDLTPKKIVLSGGNLKISTMCLDKDTLYALSTEQELFEYNLRTKEAARHSISGGLAGMSKTYNRFSLCDSSTGGFVIIDF